VQSALRDSLGKAFPIRLGVKLSVQLDDNGVRVEWTGPQSGDHRFDYLLVAAGRPPQLDDLNLAKAGITLDKHGAPVFDPQTMQCDGAAIFIAGDAAHDRPVLHEASEEGAIAGRNAAVYPDVEPGRRYVPFSIMFTDPPLVVIGETPKPGDKGCVIGAAPYEDQGRAKIMARNEGVVRLYADADGGKLRGATLFAPGAEHTGHLIAWAVQQGQTARQMLDLPFYHPTLEEGLRPALTEICDAVDSATPNDRDSGIAPGA
jgi:dihydrolipoamide dehydrogenase